MRDSCPPFRSDYMVEKLGIEESKIENLGNLLYKNYGTTMAGLRVN
jgi:putative hydrolase of the HAD superfamily